MNIEGEKFSRCLIVNIGDLVINRTGEIGIVIDIISPYDESTLYRVLLSSRSEWLPHSSIQSVYRTIADD
jgi:hypothetical protein